MATSLLLRLANVAVTAVVARILAPRDFGVFTVALTAYAIVSSAGELGVSSCLARADLDVDSLAPTAATVSLLSSALLAGAMAALAAPVAAALGSAAATGPIRVTAVALLVTGVFAVPSAQLIREFRQDKIFLANAIGFVPSTAVLIVLARSGSGAMAFAWSMVARQVVVGCVLTIAAPRHYRPGHARSALAVILRFGMPLAVANLVSYTLLNVDYALVGHLLGATSLGVYMLAFTIASWSYGALGAMINSVSMPAFSRAAHDPVQLNRAMATALRGVCLIALPASGLTAALARPLVLTLYGARWSAAADVLVVLSLYGAVFVGCLLFANMLTGLGRTRLLLGLQLVWIGTLVPAMALGVRERGIVGAAYAHVAVIVPVVLPCYLLALKQVSGIRLMALAKAVRPALLASSAAAVMARGAAAQFASPPAQLLAGVTAGGMLYAVCAGRQAASVLGRGRTTERVLRVYGAPARLAAAAAGAARALATRPDPSSAGTTVSSGRSHKSRSMR